MAALAIGVVLAAPSSVRADARRDRDHGRQSGPLDPLSAEETATTFEVIEASKQFPEGAFFPTVTLKEPTKSAACSRGRPDRPSPAEAFANVYDHASNRLYEAVVDLRTEKLVSWTLQPERQPAVFTPNTGRPTAGPRRSALAEGDEGPRDQSRRLYLDIGWAVGQT